MLKIVCCLLLLLQQTLGASLPESSNANLSSQSFFRSLITGTGGLSGEVDNEILEDEFSQSEGETQDASIPETGFGHKKAFYAYLSVTRCYHTGNTIIFDRAPVNFGNRYSVHTGVYIVPKSGLYAFTWTVAAEKKTWFVSELRVNGVVKGNIMTDSDVTGHASGIHPSTGFALVNVKHGDHVYIRYVSGYGCKVKSDRMTRSTFSGWRLS
ncbi:uncharacterized protein LOC132752988 [Ruditapes philippinarum]|uniref:uncharacterized protein LOC132752988 n=1 Tax=Ruditapes philippinarum TaxID=129788 RepID=UPI00295B1779|nr:uncharacterized protein LOC132752988 [Ruditapes philippinarum]